jgi:hypothetical protein
MLKQLTDDQYLHKAVAMATRSGTPNFYMFLGRGDQQEAQLLKGRPAAGPPQMQRAGSSHRSVIAYGPVLMT